MSRGTTTARFLLIASQDRIDKGAGAAFSFGAGYMDDVEPVQVAGRIADAGEVDPHLLDGGGIGADAGFAPGLDYREGSLQGVESVDSVLRLMLVGARFSCLSSDEKLTAYVLDFDDAIWDVEVRVLNMRCTGEYCGFCFTRNRRGEVKVVVADNNDDNEDLEIGISNLARCDACCIWKFEEQAVLPVSVDHYYEFTNKKRSIVSNQYKVKQFDNTMRLQRSIAC